MTCIWKVLVSNVSLNIEHFQTILRYLSGYWVLATIRTAEKTPRPTVLPAFPPWNTFRVSLSPRDRRDTTKMSQFCIYTSAYVYKLGQKSTHITFLNNSKFLNSRLWTFEIIVERTYDADVPSNYVRLAKNCKLWNDV